MKITTKKLTYLSLFTAVAIVLSYLEFILPPILPAVPGIKLGLANIIIIFLLYKFSLRSAVTVSLVRIFLVALLFGNTLTLIYSLFGAAFSLFIMGLLKKIGCFSKIGISISGGVFHNLGQIVAAVIIMETKEIAYFIIPLTISGIVSGTVTGLAAYYLIKISLKQKKY